MREALQILAGFLAALGLGDGRPDLVLCDSERLRDGGVLEAVGRRLAGDPAMNARARQPVQLGQITDGLSGGCEQVAEASLLSAHPRQTGTRDGGNPLSGGLAQMSHSATIPCMIEMLQDVAVHDAPQDVRDAFGWGPRISIGTADAGLCMRAIAWELREAAGRFLFESCRCPVGTPETPSQYLGPRPGDVQGFVYAGSFPAGNAIKIGCTRKPWIKHRVDQFRSGGGVPAHLDIPIRERFHLLAIVPCGLFVDAESAVLAAVREGNRRMDGPAWCAANSRGEWHERGTVLASRRSEYFHETPPVIEAVALLRDAMQVCISRRSAWLHRGAESFEELRRSVTLIGEPIGRILCSSA